MIAQCNKPAFRRQVRNFILMLSALGLAYTAPLVASAYVMQPFSAPLQPPITFSAPQMTPLSKPDQSMLPSTSFLGRIVNAALNSPSRALWSSYPASVRGQFFASATPGNDPVSTGGW